MLCLTSSEEKSIVFVAIAPANAKVGLAAISRVAIYCHRSIRMYIIGLTPFALADPFCSGPFAGHLDGEILQSVHALAPLLSCVFLQILFSQASFWSVFINSSNALGTTLRKKPVSAGTIDTIASITSFGSCRSSSSPKKAK